MLSLSRIGFFAFSLIKFWRQLDQILQDKNQSCQRCRCTQQPLNKSHPVVVELHECICEVYKAVAYDYCFLLTGRRVVNTQGGLFIGEPKNIIFLELIRQTVTEIN